MRAYYKAKHEAAPQLHAELQRNQRRKKRTLVRSFKKECAHCGEDHPATLDLHHIDPTQKDTSLAKAVDQNMATHRLIAEIAKCVVLCSNCHRKLHWQEKSTGRADVALTA